MVVKGKTESEDIEINVGKIVWSIVAVVLLIIIGFSTIFVVQAGMVGVRFDPLGGGVQANEAAEGINIKPPWVKVDKYNIKTQAYTMSKIPGEGQVATDDTIRTVTNEGLYIDLDITVQYKITAHLADRIRQEIGRDGEYQAIIVRPLIRSVIREVVSSYNAADVYGVGRTMVESEIQRKLAGELQKRYMEVENVLLREVGIPPQLVEAIEQKKQAEQEAQRMEYIIQKESLEKERKIIEAGGIAKANEIIAESLSSEYLTWYWLENLENHESVVYVMPSEGGLPLFKNIDQPKSITAGN